MNYLAHAYLSFQHKDILAGNMISDFIKGKKQFDYPAEIQAGIKLHRAIDQFTDDHPCTKIMAAVFKPTYRLYGGAFADVVYDHFLANDTTQFPTARHLLDFTTHTYAQLQENQQWLPPAFAAMFPYMQSQDWLYNYQFDSGIQKSFQGLARRAAYIPESDTAFELFLNNKELLGEQYTLFFHSVKSFAAYTMEQLFKH
ncbi:MAG: DUF479 domain-containing protein [Chitinophagaceae bacterium]|nr:MAG: DUF479 domain-containing protein [Chitinophagaceae bacterium]